MILRIHPDNPQDRHIQAAAKILDKGGTIIYPTDTVYALGCSIHSRKALEAVCRIKGIDPEKSHFTCICDDLKWVGKYAIQVHTPTYKLMKRLTPGPYTFILNASGEIPRHFQSKRKTVGIRVCDHAIPQALVRHLGYPILSTSLKDESGEHLVDPDEIVQLFEKRVDAVIDGGWGGYEPSTVLDCTEDEPEVIREGLGMDAI